MMNDWPACDGAMSAVWGGGDLHWGETIAVPPPCEPVSLTQIKRRLRIAHTAEDADLQLLLAAARRQVETDTSAVLVSSTVEQTVDAPPVGTSTLRLTRWPVQSIARITATADDGTSTDLDAASYVLDAASRPARVLLTAGAQWPAMRARAGLVVRYVAGFADVPVSLAQITWQTGVGTAQTIAAHPFMAGDSVAIRLASEEFFNGTFGVTGTSPNTFTMAMPVQPGWPDPTTPQASAALFAIALGTPEPLQLAVLALAQHWYDPLRRGLTMPWAATGEVKLPFGYDMLIADRLEWLT